MARRSSLAASSRIFSKRARVADTLNTPSGFTSSIHFTGSDFTLPATSLTKIDYLLDYVDRVLVMAVDPGYAGQKLIPTSFERVRILSQNIEHRKLPARIEVDGNIDITNAATFANVGARIFVLGSSSIFKGHEDLSEAFRAFKAAVAAERHLV